MGEVLMLIFMHPQNAINVHIVIKAWVAHVYVNEQLVMVQNDRVVHCIYFFYPLNHV
jgi:hypothetical protein